MTVTHAWLRTVVIAAAITCSPAIGAAQTAPPVHDHGMKAGVVPPVDDVAAKLASLDARIAMLTADMKMFVGEMKIQTMAALLEALVERQTLVDAEMRRMHERMGGPMNDRMRHAAPPIDPAVDLQPETLCSPFI
jgi:uncharacterized protein YjaG (DUF416 family)